MRSLFLFFLLIMSSASAYAINIPIRFGQVDINTPKFVNLAKGITTSNYAFKITSQTQTPNAAFVITNQDCQVGQVYEQEYCLLVVRFQTSAFAKQTANITVNVTFYPNPDMIASYNETYVFQMSGTGYRRLADSEDCCRKKGSIINVDNTSVSESIPLTGVPYNLAYSSDVSSYSELQDLGLNGFALDGFKFYDAARGNTVSSDGKVTKAAALNIGGVNHTLSPDGSEIYQFNEDGTINAVLDPVFGFTKAQFEYEYNYETASGGMQITDNFGSVTLFEKTGNTGQITSPYGQVTSLAFDVNGILASVTNPNGETYQTGFDADAKLTSFQKPGGQTSTLTYNATTGRLASDAAPGGFTQTLTNSVTVSGTTQTQTTTIKTPLNISTKSVFASKSNGSTATVTAPNNQISNRTVVTGVSETSNNSYGYTNTKTKTADPRFGLALPYISKDTTTVSGTSISVVRDYVKTAVLATPGDPLSHTSLVTTTKLQNNASRIFTSTFTRSTGTLVDQSPLARTMTRVYNSDGTLNSDQVGTLEPTSYTYNWQGLPLTTWRSARSNIFTYNMLGQLSSFTNPISELEIYGYDLAGRLTLKTLSDLNTIEYGYDSNGRMTSLKSPGLNLHSFAYNDFDLVSSYTPPVVGVGGIGNISYTYNLDKQLKTTTFSDGKVITNNYSTTTGFLTSKVASDTSGNYTYTYKVGTNLIGQVVSPDSVSLATTYVADKVQKYVTVIPSLMTTEYSQTFDTEFRVSSETMKVATATPAITFTYDLDGIRTGAGAITQVIDANGLMSSNTIGVLTETVTRNIFGEVTNRKTLHGSTVLYEESRTLDNLGRVTSLTENVNGTITNKGYRYDNRGRLQEIDVDGYYPFYIYYYSENGNRLGYSTPSGIGEDYTYDAQDRLLTSSNFIYAYNARGDILTSLFTYLNETTTFNYDIYSQLRSVTMPDGKIISYKLDGYGRRVARYVNGVYNRGFIYNDKNQIVAEINASKAIVVQYVYLTRPNVPDYAIMGSTKLKIISNEVGTPKMLVNTATGVVVETIMTNEFGAGAPSTNISLGFAGGLRDPDTKNLRFGAREYDPRYSRWLSKDPIGFNGGDTNFYAYVANDPINRVDPSGLLIVDRGGVVPGWIRNTPLYKELDSAAAVIIVSDKKLVNELGRTVPSKSILGAYGRLQYVDIDLSADNGSSSSICPSLTGLEDTILHELNHAKQNLSRFSADGSSEDLDNSLLPSLFKKYLKYKP